MRISYTIVDSSLGRMLVAGTARGICAVSFSDFDSTLEAELRGDYPDAKICRDEIDLSAWVDVLLSFLSGQQQDLNLPLDVTGTDFQLRVWKQLQAIPYGSTRTYGEIARALDLPVTAARAVGRACATNRVSLIIPCHRAISEDGHLTGYRWGLDRKRYLIDREAKMGQLSMFNFSNGFSTH